MWKGKYNKVKPENEWKRKNNNTKREERKKKTMQQKEKRIEEDNWVGSKDLAQGLFGRQYRTLST